MTHDDDNPLAGIDLEAFEPPPLRDQADAVIARMRAPAVEAPRRSTARTWVAAGAGLAAIASVGVIVASLVGGSSTTTPAPVVAATSGEVRATRAEHVELGASSVDLDPGSELRWRRVGDRLVATQMKGSATWRVQASDQLQLDGAAVATIDASNANLRVEVDMNASDAKVIGASAGTAAAIALVTVIVYQGHVNVSGGGTTLAVAPGTSVEVEAGGIPKVQDMLVENERLRSRTADLERQLEAARAGSSMAAGTGPATPAPLDALERKHIANGIDGIRPQLSACDDGSFTGTVRASVRVNADGTVRSVTLAPQPAFAACLQAALESVVFPTTKAGASFAYPFVFKKATPITTSPSGPCDAAELEKRGKDSFSAGQYAAATKQFHESYTCKPVTNVANLAFLSACKGKNRNMAKHYYPLISNQGLVAACRDTGIDVGASSAPDPFSSRTGGTPSGSASGGDFVDPFGARDPSARGTLRVVAQPAGTKIFVDGRYAGDAPLTAKLPVGKHEVTFQVGDDKYTFAVTIERNKTAVLSKDLR